MVCGSQNHIFGIDFDSNIYFSNHLVVMNAIDMFLHYAWTGCWDKHCWLTLLSSDESHQIWMTSSLCCWLTLERCMTRWFSILCTPSFSYWFSYMDGHHLTHWSATKTGVVSRVLTAMSMDKNEIETKGIHLM